MATNYLRLRTQLLRPCNRRKQARPRALEKMGFRVGFEGVRDHLVTTAAKSTKVKNGTLGAKPCAMRIIVNTPT
jgi:hypothetical protein